MQAKLGVPEKDPFQWTSQAGFLGQGLRKTESISALINLAAADVLKAKGVPANKGNSANMQEGMKDVFLDVSQNPTRKPWTNRRGHNHTLCTSSVLYSFAQDRMLFPEEYMFLQGWSHHMQVEESFRDELRELAGLGMALPCLGSLIWALYLVKGFPHSDS